ncbi:MAG: hypothetical protein KAZ42_03475 [Proteocatella sp.]|jgi:hypothetical protein|nr:hypothetical protein [Proteocatella sp.]MBP7913584.1 hypothetical protein [Proteocatella sp.]
MSAFLGPIHHWLFNKIQFQDQMVENVIAYAETFGRAENLREQLAARYGELEKQPLEEIIDGSNIHGWLQDRVTVVENRLAATVTQLLAEEPDRINDLRRIFFESGKEKSAAGIDSAAMIYRFLSDSLLDGMPCDRANQVVTEEDDHAVWVRNVCVHRPYWDAAGGDISVYYDLRASLIEGMLYGSSFEYQRTDENTNEIKKK